MCLRALTRAFVQDEAARQAEVEARRAAMSAVHELAQKARAAAHEGADQRAVCCCWEQQQVEGNWVLASMGKGWGS